MSLMVVVVMTTADKGKDCTRPCPMNYRPVCASDGQTYGKYTLYSSINCI